MATSPQPAFPLSHVIGRRVKAAREARGWSQDQLTQALGWKDRQSVSAVEQGKRKLSAEEIMTIAALTEREVTFFTDPLDVSGEMRFCWYLAPGEWDSSDEVLNAIEPQVCAWVGLLRWLRTQQGETLNPLKHSLRLNTRSSLMEAEVAGQALARQLQWHHGRQSRLAASIEQALDLPVLWVDLPNSVHSAVCHLPDLDVLLVNRALVATERDPALVHVLFGALAWDSLDLPVRDANPDPGLVRTFRAERLSDQFVQAALAVDSEAQQHDVEGDLGLPRRFSFSFVQLMGQAVEQGHLSARRAAKVLGMDLGSMGELFEEHGLKAPYAL